MSWQRDAFKAIEGIAIIVVVIILVIIFLGVLTS